MRRLSITILLRLGLLGLLTWVVVIGLASIAPIWAFVGTRTTTIIVPVLVAGGFGALFVGLLALLAASLWAVGAFVHRRLGRPTIERVAATDERQN
jgi:hypothetical protein